jgi:5-(carboxyamino)imidazole ribonucleotide mutase
MPPGVPVATVAINCAKNAGILAAQILGVTNEAIASEVISFKNEMNQEVLNKATSVEEIGYQQYLNNQK